MRRLARAPLVHFLVLGGVLLGLRTWWSPPDEERAPIVIGGAELGRLREAWTEEHGRPPSPAAERALVQAAIDEEVLYREALARGFDRADGAVQERLVRLASFVGEEALGGRDALEREARRLGLERGDLVIRRHLVEMMRLAAARVPPDALPRDAELETYLGRHAEEFGIPGRVRLRHIYLRNGEPAAALLAELRAAGPGAGEGRGDAFIRGPVFEGPREDIVRVFGPGFVEALDGVPLQTWAGPIRSSYGVHLVWVEGREAGRAPALEEVRGRVVHRWLEERSRQEERRTIDTLRARYAIEVSNLIARREVQ